MTSIERKQLLLAERVNSYLINTKKRSSDTQSVFGFVASIDENDPNPYRNYAVPSTALDPSSTDVSCLTQWFLERERKPRLEYMGEAAPNVEAALLAAGYAIEAELPLLTLSRPDLRVVPSVPGIELTVAVTETQLYEAAHVQNRAYGGSDVTRADVDRLLRATESGGQILIAREVRGGEVVGAGLYSPPCEGFTEIAAIGVLPTFRRLGIAAALTAALAGVGFERGVATMFLMAASETEVRIYQRVGFAVAGKILHISRPGRVAGG